MDPKGGNGSSSGGGCISGNGTSAVGAESASCSNGSSSCGDGSISGSNSSNGSGDRSVPQLAAAKSAADVVNVMFCGYAHRLGVWSAADICWKALVNVPVSNGTVKVQQLSFLAAMIVGLADWLGQGGEVLLTTEGHNAESILQSCLGVFEVLLSGSGANYELAGKLEGLGRDLTSLPVSCACNHPACCNLEGLSEQQLVKGSKRTCSGCSSARYCSKRCQVKHWQQHKPVYKALTAMASQKVAAACVSNEM